MTRSLVAIAFAFSLLLAACGDDSGGGSGDRDAIIEMLEAEGESPESAACFADELSDFSAADVQALLDGEFDPDINALIEGEDQPTAIDTALFDAVEKCAEPGSS